jgi:hypothetical protein
MFDAYLCVDDPVYAEWPSAAPMSSTIRPIVGPVGWRRLSDGVVDGCTVGVGLQVPCDDDHHHLGEDPWRFSFATTGSWKVRWTNSSQLVARLAEVDVVST